jgi:hypothetical protein
MHSTVTNFDPISSRINALTFTGTSQLVHWKSIKFLSARIQRFRSLPRHNHCAFYHPRSSSAFPAYPPPVLWSVLGFSVRFRDAYPLLVVPTKARQSGFNQHNDDQRKVYLSPTSSSFHILSTCRKSLWSAPKDSRLCHLSLWSHKRTLRPWTIPRRAVVQRTAPETECNVGQQLCLPEPRLAQYVGFIRASERLHDRRLERRS